MYINFSEIPGSKKLFLDYMYDFGKVEKFYFKNFRDEDEYPVLFDLISSRSVTDRKKIKEIIAGQYKEFKFSKQTQKNIDLLESGSTLAVVTGQQLGLMGGPLYTVYKSLTAIKLCRYLKSKYDNYNFVPIFWMEGDDHDFEEVHSFNIIGKNNDIKKFSYNDDLLPEQNRGNVGNISFNNNISEVIDLLTSDLRDSEFKESLIDLLKSAYKEGETFKTAFKKLHYSLFDEFGLIIFDPQDIEIKSLLKPVFKKEISDYKDHTSSIIETSAELEENYPAQVKVKPINLFITEDGIRHSIEPVEHEYRLKGKRKKFTLEELLNRIETNPADFSPNVLLRPICQDYIFPTAFYIGGPGEISYFAQLLPLYKHFELTAPILYPRSSITIIESNTENLLEKFGITPQNIFTDKNQLKNLILNKVSDTDIDEIFKNTNEEISKIFSRLGEVLLPLEKNLKDPFEKTGQKINQALDMLKDRTTKAQANRHESTVRQLDKIITLLYPNNNLQERELNFITFANKYGMDIFRWILDEMTINKYEHQLLSL